MSTTVKLTFETGDRPPDEVEREVRAAIEAETGEPPNTSQYAGSVVWSPNGTTEIEYVQDVEVPRVVRTKFNDTVDAGSGTLFERVDGRFVAVDRIHSPELDMGEYVLDYFRINFGIAPWYRYSKPEDAGATTRPEGRENWQSILSPATFEVPDLEGEATAVEGLTADDRAVRNRAVRYLAYEGIDDPERYEQFLSALSTVSERTRAIVASELWWPTPLGQGIDASLVTELLSLTDDPVPEVRIGAFMGASRAIEALHEQVDADGGPPEEEVDAVVKQFYEAHAALLNDPDPRIRERTVRCYGETLGKEGLHIFSDDLWLRVDFPLRWRIVRAAEANVHDDALGTIDNTATLTTMAFRGEHAAIPSLVKYVYDEQGPSHRAVRSMLADFAMDEPAAALDALDPALEAVKTSDELVADLRLLAALADERPNRVATVAADLAAILNGRSAGPDDEDANETRHHNDYVDQDDPEEKRCAAAQALNKLPADTHSVNRVKLVAATGDVTRQTYGRAALAPDRVAALAEVAPEAAIDRLGDLPDEMRDDRRDDGFSRSNIESAVYETSTTAPEVVGRALPELVALFDDPPDVSDELVVAIARTAVECPEAIADHVDAVATCLGHYEPIVREATATTLVAVGQRRPAALPPTYSALLDRADDALDVETLEMIRERTDRSPETPADWPAGVLASNPSVLANGVIACLGEGFPWHEKLADLLREVQANSLNAAERLLEALLDRRRSAILPSSYQTGVLTRLADTDPALLSGVAESVVGVLADPDFKTRKSPDDEQSLASSKARSLEIGLLSIAQTDPETADAAIEAHYPSVEVFLKAHETDRRRDIVAHIEDAETTPRVDTDASAADSLSGADPFYSLESGAYGADLVVDTDDFDAESIPDEMQLVRCRVTDDNKLRQIDTGTFVRRTVGSEGPIGTVPDDADPAEEMVSVLLHSSIPTSFVRLATPDDENVLTRVMNLELDVDMFELLTHLCHSLGDEYNREDVKRIEQWVSRLDAIEDVDGAAELVQKQLL